MVFQKKGCVKGKQQTSFKGKNKTFEAEDDDIDMFDMESDDEDSSGDEQVQKTPGNKMPKERQVLSDKKVSFQIPTKNTPGKTPKNDTSLVGKKQQQVTPCKTVVKEFKGMMSKNSPTPKKNGKVKAVVKQDEEEEEDDDDSEDVDLDMMLGSDDDDDDDDDEEDDDDDDDDEDEEEEEEVPQKNTKQLIPSKNQNSVKTPVKVENTPVKSTEKVKNAGKTQLKKDKTPLKVAVKGPSPQKSPEKKKDLTPGVKKAYESEQGSRRERDARTLFVGNLPEDISPTELKALSSDILSVSIPRSNNPRKRKAIFGFLEFANESKADANFVTLQKKKLRGEPLTLDFTGAKSSKKQNADESSTDKPINLKKLYASSLPGDVTIDQVAKLFPKSYQITIVQNPTFKTALLNYINDKDAADDFEAAKGAMISGKPITVLYSVIKDSKKGKKRRKKNKKSSSNQNPAKKMKVEVQDSDDDDDDDDDDDV